MAPETASFDQAIRELFFGAGNRGTYRFLFVVLAEEKSVYILQVRHVLCSRFNLTPTLIIEVSRRPSAATPIY
jgi:hypothetical protein